MTSYDNLCNILTSLLLKEKYIKKIETIIELLEAEETRDIIDSIILFGSCARGQAVLGSDVDLCVILNQPIDRYTKGYLQCEASEMINGIKADLLFYTKQEFDEAQGTFIELVKKEGVIIWEREKPTMNMQ